MLLFISRAYFVNILHLAFFFVLDLELFVFKKTQLLPITCHFILESSYQRVTLLGLFHKDPIFCLSFSYFRPIFFQNKPTFIYYLLFH